MKGDKVKVVVTQEIIDKAYENALVDGNYCRSCVLGRAVEEATGLPSTVAICTATSFKDERG